MTHLIGGANEEGYSHALARAFGEKAEYAPVKSSLAKLRKKISYKFFEEIFSKLLRQLDPYSERYLGLRIYAIDGQMLSIPRSKEIVDAGYSGRAIGKFRESYYPKAFFTHAYDVLSGFTKATSFGPRLHEQADGLMLMKSFERESLTLYDRLYFSRRLVAAHYEAGNYFLCRIRKNANREITAFVASAEKERTIKVAQHSVHLMRILASDKKTVLLFATNLPKELVRPQIIRKLYRLRWEVETSFRELTGITRGEQWHSKNVNGLLQELFARLWLINAAKFEVRMAKEERQAEREGKISKIKKGKKSKKTIKAGKNPLRDDYERANFKLTYNLLLMLFPKILSGNHRAVRFLRQQTKKSTEQRTHEKRSYKREIKKSVSPYKRKSTLWQWER